MSLDISKQDRKTHFIRKLVKWVFLCRWCKNMVVGEVFVEYNSLIY